MLRNLARVFDYWNINFSIYYPLISIWRFMSRYFVRFLRNTIQISAMVLLFGFPLFTEIIYKRSTCRIGERIAGNDWLKNEFFLRLIWLIYEPKKIARNYNSRTASFIYVILINKHLLYFSTTTSLVPLYFKIRVRPSGSWVYPQSRVIPVLSAMPIKQACSL